MNVFNPFQVGSLAAVHLGKRGFNVDLYEYREGETLFEFPKKCAIYC